MKFGVCIFQTAETIPLVDLAVTVEERGFDLLLLTERTHIPSSRDTPFPRGGELPAEYSRTFDPFVALGGVAAVTSRLRFGTGVCLVNERDPIIMAKEVATLDQISGGRLELGVGAGWNREEMRNHGSAPERRMTMMRERIEAMQAIWRDDVATYHGRNVSFDAIWCWPKPVQQPHPPILIGGDANRALDRVVAYGDGWMPVDPRDDDRLQAKISALQERASAAGRDRIPVTLFGARADRAAVKRYAAMGVDRCVFRLPTAPTPEVLARLDQGTQVMHQYV